MLILSHANTVHPHPTSILVNSLPFDAARNLIFRRISDTWLPALLGGTNDSSEHDTLPWGSHLSCRSDSLTLGGKQREEVSHNHHH